MLKVCLFYLQGSSLLVDNALVDIDQLIKDINSSDIEAVKNAIGTIANICTNNGKTQKTLIYN